VCYLIRNTFHVASRQHWDTIVRDLRPVYTAVNEAEVRTRLDDI
jgi:transposase-like protein